MISWAWDEDDRYQREMDAMERERMVAGWEPPMGWLRPTDPACPAHGYGMVDGTCGVCVEELKASLSERGADRDTARAVKARVALRSESDEAAA